MIYGRRIENLFFKFLEYPFIKDWMRISWVFWSRYVDNISSSRSRTDSYNKKYFALTANYRDLL